ncbi:MAG: hypothetical protein ACRD4P_15865 [Bryobacteraceae bacterium]
MDIHRILEELRRERESIEEVILLLERMEAGTTRRRGRPTQWLQQARDAASDGETAPEAKRKRTVSAESRRRMAEGQRRRREREKEEINRS